MPLRFRAARRAGPSGNVALAIEASRGGPWEPGVFGLSEQQVQVQLERLLARGHEIVDTADFKFKRPT